MLRGIALVTLVGIGLVGGTGPAAADCNLEARPLRSAADARGLTFTGTLTSVMHGAGEVLTFEVDDVFAGRRADAHHLRSPECASLWHADAGTLVIGTRYFVSTGDPGKPGVGNTVVYVERAGASWSLVEYDGQPTPFHQTMTLASLLDLIAPETLPPTSTAPVSLELDERLPVGLLFALTLLVGARRVRRRLVAGTDD